ncbi:MAG: hypothetical protein MUF05_06310 [Candidatus Omnitrophica bacterium]|jgi:phosphoribosylaminoimidazolecarboxamide formyltransferase/IMP cyclohydrolase|nr:hypothetical protein [Candidatus Omnitrophota bacterium]
MRKRALISVNVHPGLEDLSLRLSRAGWEIVSTKDACDFLRSKKIPVVQVEDFVDFRYDLNFPATLHPLIEKALTQDSDQRIDLVYDIPYSLSAGNDVGGLALLALAVKGNRIPVMHLSDMERVVSLLEKKGKVPHDVVHELQVQANLAISAHYLKIVNNSEDVQVLQGVKKYQLSNGENPYQSPAYLYSIADHDPLGLGAFKQIHGESPCFTNLADFDAILETISRLYSCLVLNSVEKPFICVAAKHGNPCGIGVSRNDPLKALACALWGNPRAIWGGELIVNFTITPDLAKVMKNSLHRKKEYGSGSWMLDLIACPQINPAALEVLSANTNRKIFINPSLREPFLRHHKQSLRMVRCGFLSQPYADYILDLHSLRWVVPLKDYRRVIDIAIAWAACYTSNLGGNEVALAKDAALLSIGGGPSTFDAASIALARASSNAHNPRRAVFAADAFFPFLDAVQLLCKSGVLAGVVPEGGKRENLVEKYFIDNRIQVGFIPKEFRGFCRH